MIVYYSLYCLGISRNSQGFPINKTSRSESIPYDQVNFCFNGDDVELTIFLPFVLVLHCSGVSLDKMSLKWRRCDECPQNGESNIHFTPSFGELTTSCFLNLIFFCWLLGFIFLVIFLRIILWNSSPSFTTIWENIWIFPSILAKQIQDCDV